MLQTAYNYLHKQTVLYTQDTAQMTSVYVHNNGACLQKTAPKT